RPRSGSPETASGMTGHRARSGAGGRSTERRRGYWCPRNTVARRQVSRAMTPKLDPFLRGAALDPTCLTIAGATYGASAPDAFGADRVGRPSLAEQHGQPP